MSSSSENAAIEELVANVLDTRFENFDQATIENARNRIIDVLGCLIGGANAPGNSALIGLVREWGGREEATILVHGGRLPAHSAAMVNSIMARSYDFEPVESTVDGRGMPTHISGTTVVTAITMGEVKNINGKELITALLVGDDVASRVLAGSNYNLAQGWDCVGTVNAFGATAIAGRLLGLTKLELRNAFGLVLNQLAGSFQCTWDGTTAFKLNQGLSARNGIISAQLARAGWTGPEDALLGRFGYYRLYTEGCVNPEILTQDLGKKYYADSNIKPYPCCRGTHAAVDCALTMVSKCEMKAEDIEEVIIYVPQTALHSFLGQPFRIGDFLHANGIFSLSYTVANALLRKAVRPDHFSEQSIRDPRIGAIISKTRLAELSGAEGLSAKVEVKKKDGRVFSEFTNTPKGDPISNPMSRDEIIAKFWTNVDFSQMVSKDNAEKLLKLLERLEEVDSVNEIVRTLEIQLESPEA